MDIQRQKEIKELAQGHKVNNELQSQDFNLNILAPDFNKGTKI